MSKLNISVSPHIRSNQTTRKIMLDVIIAMLPAFGASIWLFGVRSLYITSVCILTCILGEIIFELIVKREVTAGDLSAVVTGMLLSFNLPVNIPAWQAIVGSLIAIVVIKQLFGGIGYNFANPAIAARVAMFLSFPDTMSKFTPARTAADLTSYATPLSELKSGAAATPTLWQMLIGDRGGCLGETCAIALLIGFVYLLCRRVITWHIPTVFVGTVFVLSLIAGGDVTDAVYQILGGGLLLGAIFMATDYVTSPPTAWGKVIFGFGCGLVTFAIRYLGAYAEGVSFAILFMNILTPYISKLTAHKPFGLVKEKEEA